MYIKQPEPHFTPARRCALKCLLNAALALFICSFVHADVEQDLLKHLATAEKNLTRSQQQVSRERQQLAKQLNTLENQVIALREKTAVTRRAADEQTLSLTQLENRLDAWRQQSQYQRNLLNRFVQQHAQDDTLNPTIDDQINLILQISQSLESQFSPQWRSEELIMPNGEIQTQPVLSIGPVTWFAAGNQAGIAKRDDTGQLVSEVILDSAASDIIITTQNATIGEIVFDPTLSRALAREQSNETLTEHVQKGGLWAIPILAFAVFALAIALIKVVQLAYLPKVVRFTPSVLSAALSNANSPTTANVKGMQRALLDIAQNGNNERERDDQLFMQLQDDKHTLDRWIGAIAITAAVSPLLGLLGTVSGMIETFKMMTLFGSGDPEVVSGGIAQALVTTELGLVVAIPALILNAVLSRKARSYYNALESFAILISKSYATSKTTLDTAKTSQPSVLTTRKQNVESTKTNEVPA